MADDSKGRIIVLEDWMFGLTDRQGRRLTDTAIHLYALIYGFAKHRAGCYYGSREYTAKRLHISVSSARNAFALLEASGLIQETSSYTQGQKSPKQYTINTNACTGPRLTGVNLGQAKLPDNESPGQEDGFLPENPQKTELTGVDSTGVGFAREKPGLTPPQGQDLPSTGSNLDRTGVPKPVVAMNGTGRENKGKPKINKRSVKNGGVAGTVQGIGIQALGRDFSEQEVEAFETLVGLSLKKVYDIADVAKAYAAVLEKGYTGDQAVKAYKRYIGRYREKNPDTTAFAKQLSSYLLEGDGLLFDAGFPRQRSEPVPAPQEDAYEQDKDYSDCKAELFALLARRTQAVLLKAPKEEVDSLSQKIAGKKQLLEGIRKRIDEEGGPHGEAEG